MNGQGNPVENIRDFVVRTVFADGLALLGARPSAGTVTTKLGSCVCIQDHHLKGYSVKPLI